MSRPRIAGNRPLQVELEAGRTYYFCACGRSGNQPFCDGSHKATDLVPVPHTAEATGTAFMCVCKHAAKFPFCDGTHKRFSAAEIGREV